MPLIRQACAMFLKGQQFNKVLAEVNDVGAAYQLIKRLVTPLDSP